MKNGICFLYMLWKQHPVCLVTLGKVSTFIALTMRQNLSATTGFSGLEENATFNKGHRNVPKENPDSTSFSTEKMILGLPKSVDLTGRVREIWLKRRNSHYSENGIADSTVSR